MPPKKKARLTESIRTDLEAAFDAVRRQDLVAPDRLPDDLVLRAYGLAGPRKGQQDGAAFNRTCPPRWQPGASPQDGTATKSTTPASRATSTEVLILDTGSERSADEAQPRPILKPTKGKGKGKAKAVVEAGKEKPCSPENCGNNPNCLNWLGQDKWENTKKALADFRKAAKLPDDPTNERDPDLPGGLVNLGATCYANSFLQVWYRDVRFRRGVYSCLPASNGNVETSPMFQLQVLFAFLQKSQQAAYDPEPLVEALKIKKTEQQDAQEFSKLFLNLLDHEFKKQAKRAEAEGGDASIGTLVEDLFEGQITYGTRCLKCGTESERSSSFLELEISLSKTCKLENRLEHSLETELLNGDNKYVCDNCNNKQDAERYQRLTSLPPVLHFSILRFVFDFDTLERRKSQSAISYPLQLDMGQFLDPDASGNRPEVWYDLKGVLMHKGVSAHHGHYVAQVYDEGRGKWFLFDDETVSPIDDLNSPTVHDEDGAPVTSKKRPAAGFVRGADGNILPKSKDAYMLVYSRREVASGVAAPEPEPPALAAAAVENRDAEYREEVSKFEVKSQQVDRAFKETRAKKRAIYQQWQTRQADENSFLVDKNELRRWMEEGLKTPAKEASKETSPLQTNGHPPTNTEAPDTGAETGNAAVSSAPDPPIERLEGHSDEAAVMAVTAAATSTDDLPDPKTIGKIAEQEESIRRLSNDRVLCPHGKAEVRKAECLKRLPESALVALEGAGVTVEPMLRVPEELCRTCVAGLAADFIYQREHPALVEEFGAANHLREAPDKLISSNWLKDWLKTSPKMHKPGTLFDPSPSDGEYLSDVQCEHGLRQPDAKRRAVITDKAVKVLRRIFPTWQALDLDPCEICEIALNATSAEMEELKSRHASDKRNVASLSQSNLGGIGRLPLTGDEFASFVIPREWTRKWLKWIRLKTFTAADQPGNLDNRRLVCEHGKLCFDVQAEYESPETISLVTGKEWAYLEKGYSAGPAINLWYERGEGPVSRLPVCQECLNEQKKSFESAALRIRILSDQDFDEDGERKIIGAEPTPPVAPPYAQGLSHMATGSRSSRRISEKPQMAWNKALRRIQMAKDDRVMDLKHKIETATNIPFISQRLFYQSKELSEASVTVLELGLLPGDTLEVYGVEVDEDDLGKLDERSRKGRKKREREEGFGGTGLFGFEGADVEDAASGDSSRASTTAVEPAGHSGPSKPTSEASKVAPWADEDVEMATENKLSCPECTFLNHADLTECEICDARLSS